MARTKKGTQGNTSNLYKEYELEWNGQKIMVKNMIRPTDAYSIIHSVSENAFSQSGKYQPEISSLLWVSIIIPALSDYNMPSEPDELFAICFGTDLYEQIVNASGANRQLEWMKKAIADRISFAADRRENDMQNKINELSFTVQQVAEKMGNMFGDVSSDDIKSLIHSMSEGKLDENKLVEAYMNHK